MDDERLLSEALRAHAAGGVSTPRPAPVADPSVTPASGDAEDTSKRRRFRPLGRARRGPDATDAPTTVQPAPLRGTRTDTPRPGIPRSDVPAPRSGGPAAPPPGPRPVHPPAARLPAPARPAPSSGPFGVPTGPYGPPPGGARPAGPAAPATEGPGAWDAATVAWWGAVALLAGGSVGSAVAVLSLLLPA